MGKQIFISDLHINDARSQAGSQPYGWLPADAAARLINFLSYISNRKDVDELILLGDTLDTWVCPINIVPQDVDSILQDNKNIVNAFNLIMSKNIKLSYVVGNHDMLVTEDILKKYLPGINFIEDDKKGNNNAEWTGYSNGQIKAEHGNAYAMFNARDFENDPTQGLPLGYYISRIAASSGKKVHVEQIVEEKVNSVEKGILPNVVIDVLLEAKGLTETDEIILPNKSTIKIGDIKAKYTNLNRQWIEKYGPEIALEGLIAEIGIMDKPACNICVDGTNIVLFGHTHHEMLTQNEFKVNHIYANTGTWCEEKGSSDTKIPSYVEIEKDLTNKRVNVTLYHWLNNTPELVNKGAILLS